MDMNDTQSQVRRLQQEINEGYAALSLLNANIDALQDARCHVSAAREEAAALSHLLGCFALAGWSGRHANAFMGTVGQGGRASLNAEELLNGCDDLLRQMDAKMSCFNGQCTSLRSNLAANERRLNRMQSSIACSRRGR